MLGTLWALPSPIKSTSSTSRGVKKSVETYKIYIFKLLKRVVDTDILSKALPIMNSFFIGIFEKLVRSNNEIYFRQ
jgi:histone H2B